MQHSDHYYPGKNNKVFNLLTVALTQSGPAMSLTHQSLLLQNESLMLNLLPYPCDPHTSPLNIAIVTNPHSSILNLEYYPCKNFWLQA